LAELQAVGFYGWWQTQLHRIGTDGECSFWTYAPLGDMKCQEGVYEGFIFTFTRILGLFL